MNCGKTCGKLLKALSYLLNFGTAKCLLIIIWSSALFIAKKLIFYLSSIFCWWALPSAIALRKDLINMQVIGSRCWYLVLVKENLWTNCIQGSVLKSWRPGQFCQLIFKIENLCQSSKGWVTSLQVSWISRKLSRKTISLAQSENFSYVETFFYCLLSQAMGPGS